MGIVAWGSVALNYDLFKISRDKLILLTFRKEIPDKVIKLHGSAEWKRVSHKRD